MRGTSIKWTWAEHCCYQSVCFYVWTFCLKMLCTSVFVWVTSVTVHGIVSLRVSHGGLVKILVIHRPWSRLQKCFSWKYVQGAAASPLKGLATNNNKKKNSMSSMKFYKHTMWCLWSSCCSVLLNIIYIDCDCSEKEDQVGWLTHWYLF